jgi:hypothetical protein
MNLIAMDNVIHEIYLVMAAVFGLLLLRGLFFRKTRRTLVYDIVYAYTLIPFLLRALRIK